MKLAGWLLLGLLIEGVLAVPMYFLADYLPDPWSFYIVVIMISFVICAGIVGLSLALATWAVMSGKMVHWRLIGVTVPFIFLICLSHTPEANSTPANNPFLVLQVLTFFQGLLLLFLRGAGIRLESTSHTAVAKMGLQMAGPEDVDDDTQRPRFQFTIATMLSWTAALAVLLSSLNTAEFVLGEGTLRELFTWQGLFFYSLSGLYAVALLWAVFSTRSVWERIGTLILAVLLPVLHTSIFSDLSCFGLGAVLSADGGILLGILFHLIMFLPARLAGYRLVRHRRVAVRS